MTFSTALTVAWGWVAYIFRAPSTFTLCCRLLDLAMVPGLAWVLALASRWVRQVWGFSSGSGVAFAAVAVAGCSNRHIALYWWGVFKPSFCKLASVALVEASLVLSASTSDCNCWTVVVADFREHHWHINGRLPDLLSSLKWRFVIPAQ